MCVYYYLISVDVIPLVDMNLYYTDIMYILNKNYFLLYNFTHTQQPILINYICIAFPILEGIGLIKENRRL